MVRKIGAPIWLSIIVVAWGIVAASTAAMKNVGHFYLFRFLLGMCEAGESSPWVKHANGRSHINLSLQVTGLDRLLIYYFLMWPSMTRSIGLSVLVCHSKLEMRYVPGESDRRMR